MATYGEIRDLMAVNGTDATKVAALAESMREEGWRGAPILFCRDYGLVTGSHRAAALRELCDGDDFAPEWLDSEDVAADVTDEVAAWCERTGLTFWDFPFDNIGEALSGTFAEQWADEIEEW